MQEKINNLNIAWRSIPIENIGGDVLDIFRLDETHIGIYLADVSGHNLSSAYIGFSLSEIFHKYKILVHQEYKSSLLSPKQMLYIFDQEYPLGKISLFITLVYLIVDLEKGELSYSNAGHPPPIFISRKRGVEILEKHGGIIGFANWIPFEEETIALESGDKLLLYTDGVYETEDSEGNFFGIDRLFKLIGSLKDKSPEIIVEAVMDSINKYRASIPFTDDVSLICLEWE